MRKLLVVVLFLNSILIAKGQNLTVEGTAPDLYVTHIVAPKENFYSIGRLYNQAPKTIAALNKITMEKGLTIGQHIKIPLNAQNFDAADNTTAGIPLTHIVAKSETLFKIAHDNNITAEQIRKWNSLSSDNIAPGTPLVIGHLKMTTGQGSASVATSNSATNNSAPASEKPVENTEAKQATNEVKQDGSSASAGETPASSTTSISKKDTALAVIPEETQQTTSTADPAVKEEPVKQAESSSTKTANIKRSGAATSETGNTTDGFFANLFDQTGSQKSLNTKSGEAATFKSTSGWQDKKYYVLMSDVAPGTILKISSSENKVVYAKVLGSMPEMKENNGLLLRISNAAASYLGIIDPKFPVQISYYQ